MPYTDPEIALEMSLEGLRVSVDSLPLRYASAGNDIESLTLGVIPPILRIGPASRRRGKGTSFFGQV